MRLVIIEDVSATEATQRIKSSNEDFKKTIHKNIFDNLPICYDYLCKEKNNYQQLNNGSVLKGTRRLFTWRDENP